MRGVGAFDLRSHAAMVEVENEIGAGNLLAAALRGAVEDLELLRDRGREEFEEQLRRMVRNGGPGRKFFGLGKWVLSGHYLNADDLERILEVPEWVRGEQCRGWCGLLGIDHEAFLAGLTDRGLL